MALRSRPRTVLIAILSLILTIEWTAPRGKKADLYGAPLAVEEKVQTEPPRVHKPAILQQIVLQRPLFDPNRLPPINISASSNEHSPGDARLSGIIITRSMRGAIFAPEGGGKSYTVAEGSHVNGSTISRIESERVFLSNGVVLKPSFKTSPVSSDHGLMSLPVSSTETTRRNVATTPLQRSLLGASQAPQQEGGLNPTGSLYGQPGQGVPMSYHPRLIAHRIN